MKRVLVCIAALLLGSQNSSADGGVEFSADTYQRSSRGVEQKGRIYSGANRMRTESAPGPQQVIHIIDEVRGKRWLLFPGERRYAEKRVPPAPTPNPLTGEIDPCQGISGARCERLGEEVWSGRLAVKWRMTLRHGRDSETVTQWIDKERGTPLRSQRLSGQRMVMRLIGPDTLHGRPVEKWEMVRSGGELPVAQRSTQWYDPQLKLVIREELSSGFLRELKNIRIGPQPASLFLVPRGWTRMTPPAAGGPGVR